MLLGCREQILSVKNKGFLAGDRLKKGFFNSPYRKFRREVFFGTPCRLCDKKYLGIKNLASNRQDIGIACKAGNNGSGGKGSGFHVDLLKKDGDLRQNPTMLRRHYRGEDSHQGPFKASGRNLARSDLKCNLRGILCVIRRAADRSGRLHASSVSDHHRALTATLRTHSGSLPLPMHYKDPTDVRMRTGP